MGADVIKIKQIRRQLLTHLNIVYPTAMQIESLYRSLCGVDPTYDFSLFEKDIAYFGDKDYIRYVDDSILGCTDFKDKFIVLTAEGKEIAERTATDPALEI